MENELKSVKQKVKRLISDSQYFNSNHYDHKGLKPPYYAAPYFIVHWQLG